MNDLSLRLLRAFTTLAAEGQFRKAAEKFNVSQSAFSQMIARLEDQVGAHLVARDSRNVSLTREGELLLPLAEQMQADADLLVRRLRDHAQHRRGNLAISALPTLAMEWLPAVMAKFREASPGTRVRLFDFPQLDRSWQMLRARQVDLVVYPTLGHSDEFESTALFDESYFLVCPPDHPLLTRKRLWLKDLKDQPYISFQPSGSLGKILNPMLAKVRLQDTGLAMDYHTSIAGLIANGFGVTVVPGLSTLHYRRSGLASVPLQDAGLRRRFVAMKRRGEALSPAAAELLELIVANPPAGTLPVKKAAPRKAAKRARR
jgi:LysR family transcriptional regulator, carnitine catabolism transcriptional activator